MHRSLRGMLCLALACTATFGLAACDDDDEGGGTDVEDDSVDGERLPASSMFLSPAENPRKVRSATTAPTMPQIAATRTRG